MHRSTAIPQDVRTRAEGLLINRDFALLWLGQSISNLGDFTFETALVLWIATRIAVGHSWAPLAVSGVLVATAVPTVLIGPAAGVFVDRWDARRTMLRMDAVRGALILLLPFLTGLIPLPGIGSPEQPPGVTLGLIYATVALATAAAQFFRPARMAMISDIVPPDDRARATGMSQITLFMGIILGPPLAALLVTSVGIEWALWLNALSFGASYLAVRAVRSPPVPTVTGREPTHKFRGELVEGVRFVLRDRVLSTLLLAIVVLMLGGGAMTALGVFFVTQNLHASARAYGFLEGVYGFGALAGAVAGTAVARRVAPARMVWLSLVLLGTFILLYSRTTTVAVAAVFFFLAGIPNATLNIAAGPLMIGAAPREMIGRVSAIVQPLSQLAQIVSVALAGILASTVLRGFHATILGLTFGPIDTILTGASLCAIAAGIVCMVRLRGGPAPLAHGHREGER